MDRRQLLQRAVGAGLVALGVEDPAAISAAPVVSTAGDVVSLSGYWTYFDHERGVLGYVYLAILSDGNGRSEFVVRAPFAEQEERLVFTTETNWGPVAHLTTVIRDLAETTAPLGKDSADR